jgi:hypothetical protein
MFWKKARGACYASLHLSTALPASDLLFEDELSGARGAEADAALVRDLTLFDPEHGHALPLGAVFLGLAAPSRQYHLQPCSPKRTDNPTKEQGYENKGAAPGTQTGVANVYILAVMLLNGFCCSSVCFQIAQSRIGPSSSCTESSAKARTRLKSALPVFWIWALSNPRSALPHRTRPPSSSARRAPTRQTSVS